jgi:predicted TIM-barrel fold metal-dependent hydrolase
MTFTHYDFDYFDVHTHFFPPQIFDAIWDFFEQRDEKDRITGWPVNYKLSTDELVDVLNSKNVKYFTTHNYAHKAGIAIYINEWTNEFAKTNNIVIPFGCVWPDDSNRFDYIEKIFDEYNFYGIKIQPLVQKFHLDDERMYKIYDFILDRGKWLMVHIGTAPYRNEYVGYDNFMNFMEKYPDIKVIVAHMGAFEYNKFLKLLDKHQNLYLDTAMIYIPNNIFPERGPKRPKPNDLVSYQDRILFGSDFPNIPYEYENATKGLLQFDLSKSFYHNIFFKNAKRIFKVK